MRSSAVSLICAAAVVLSAVPCGGSPQIFTALTASAEQAPLTLTTTASSGGKATENAEANNYNGGWADIVKSYIYEDAGCPVRLESTADGVIIEEYSADGKTMTMSRTLAHELPDFAGAYIGSKYNFLIFAQDNYDEDDTADFASVVKYDKMWNKLGSCELAAEEAVGIAKYGSLRMTEADGVLYVHTCYQRYMDTAGVRTQSSFTFFVNESDMSWDREMRPYMSHSFDQYVRAEGGTLYLLDLGDSYDRSVRLSAVSISDTEAVIKTADLLKIGSTYGEMSAYTGVMLGGMETAGGNILAAGCTADQSNLSTSAQKNVFLSVSDSSLTNVKQIMLTSYGENDNVAVGCPQLVRIGENSLLVLWEETTAEGEKLMTAFVDSNGTVTERGSYPGVYLSDCAPAVFSDGSVRWYVTKGGSPVFCTLGAAQQAPARVPGDANGDGKTDNADAALLQKHFAGWDVTFNTSNADADRNGSVEPADLALIQKSLAGWDVIFPE